MSAGNPATVTPVHHETNLAHSVVRRIKGLALWQRLAMGVLVSLPFIGVQEVVGPDIPGNPFLVMLPGVLMASVLLRWQGGLVALAVLAAYADYYHLDAPGFAITTPESMFAFALFIAVGVYVVAIVHSMHSALSRQESLVEEQRKMMVELARARDECAAAERSKDVVVREMNHRVKNAIASVASVGRQTLRSATTMEEFAASFDTRIHALTRTQDLIALGGYSTGADLGDIVECEVEPFRGQGNCTVEGPRVRLGPKSALSLGLALHELATNAAKYGALSPVGTGLDVRWDVAGDEVVMRWDESVSTPAAEPSRKGFGTRLLDGTVRSFGGVSVRTVAPEGYRFHITMSLRELEA